jgi:hypothetical protein
VRGKPTVVLVEVVKKQAAVATRYPHHYANALFLTICAAVLGELKLTVVCFFWLYALGENYTDGSDNALRQLWGVFARLNNQQRGTRNEDETGS